LLSGFWHGANWTFIVWGALHGTYLLGGRLLGLLRNRFGWRPPSEAGPLRKAVAMLFTFHLVLIAWVFFRADHLGVAFDIARRMLVPTGRVFFDPMLVQGLFGIAMMLAADVFHRRTDYWQNLARYPLAFRFSYSLGLLFAIVLFGIERGSQFIYFQF